MNKVLAVYRHEWALKRRNNLLKLLFVVCQVLMLIALLSGWSQHQQTTKQQAEAQTLVEKQWNSQPDRHPHRVAHFGHFTFRPPSALSFFDIGVNNYVGNSIFIEAHRQNSANFANDQGSDTLLRFSELSVANLLLTFWPLMLISMAFGTIASERKSGTLRQLLSIDVSLSQVLSGKGLCYLVISLLFVLPVFFATTMLVGFSELALSADILLRILMLLSIYLIYCFIWIGLILLVSSLVAIPRHSLTVLVSIWFALVVITPRLLADIAADKYPQLSRNAFDREIKQQVSLVGDSHNPDDPHFNEFKAKVLEKYRVDSVEQLPVNYRALVMQEGERISSEIFANLYRQSMQQQEKQAEFISYFYWVNPYLLFRDLSMAIAATDVRHFYDYELQSEMHRYKRIEKLNSIHAEHIDYANDRGSKAHHDIWSEFQAFEYHQPNLAASLRPFKGNWPAPLAFLTCCILILNSRRMKRTVYALA